MTSVGSDVLRLSLRNLPDALLGVAAGRRASDAPPGRDEVGVAPGVREGVGRAAGPAATLEGRRLFPLLLLELHLVLLPVSLDLRGDGK